MPRVTDEVKAAEAAVIQAERAVLEVARGMTDFRGEMCSALVAADQRLHNARLRAKLDRYFRRKLGR